MSAERRPDFLPWLECAECGARFRLRNTTPGKAHTCPHCRGDLLTADAVGLACDYCGWMGAPRRLSLAAPPVCSQCRAPARIVPYLPHLPLPFPGGGAALAAAPAARPPGGPPAPAWPPEAFEELREFRRALASLSGQLDRKTGPLADLALLRERFDGLYSQLLSRPSPGAAKVSEQLDGLKNQIQLLAVKVEAAASPGDAAAAERFAELERRFAALAETVTGAVQAAGDDAPVLRDRLDKLAALEESLSAIAAGLGDGPVAAISAEVGKLAGLGDQVELVARRLDESGASPKLRAEIDKISASLERLHGENARDYRIDHIAQRLADLSDRLELARAALEERLVEIPATLSQPLPFTITPEFMSLRETLDAAAGDLRVLREAGGREFHQEIVGLRERLEAMAGGLDKLLSGADATAEGVAKTVADMAETVAGTVAGTVQPAVERLTAASGALESGLAAWGGKWLAEDASERLAGEMAEKILPELAETLVARTPEQVALVRAEENYALARVAGEEALTAWAGQDGRLQRLVPAWVLLALTLPMAAVLAWLVLAPAPAPAPAGLPHIQSQLADINALLERSRQAAANLPETERDRIAAHLAGLEQEMRSLSEKALEHANISGANSGRLIEMQRYMADQNERIRTYLNMLDENGRRQAAYRDEIVALKLQLARASRRDGAIAPAAKANAAPSAGPAVAAPAPARAAEPEASAFAVPAAVTNPALVAESTFNSPAGAAAAGLAESGAAMPASGFPAPQPAQVTVADFPFNNDPIPWGDSPPPLPPMTPILPLPPPTPIPASLP